MWWPRFRPGAPNAGIALEGLHKSFGAVTAVRGVDVWISPGETVALLGPNGAGKSTTIDMMLGLSRTDAGRVSLFGHPPAEATRAGLVSGMLQVGELIRDLTVRELVTMMASLYPAALDVDEVLQLTGTAEIAARRTQKLSGGQSQRVRFAIALVANADLLVLDEPTVALDVEGRQEFWKAMPAVAASGKTVVFATHYLEEADAYADRINATVMPPRCSVATPTPPSIGCWPTIPGPVTSRCGGPVSKRRSSSFRWSSPWCCSLPSPGPTVMPGSMGSTSGPSCSRAI